MVNTFNHIEADQLKSKLNLLTPAKRALLLQLVNRKNQDNKQDQLVWDEENRFNTFPLTDLQEAYWIGRSGIFEVGNVASHSYVEVEIDNLDLPRLEYAWQRLIERHDMLRAIITADGRQVVLKDAPKYRIKCIDLSRNHPDNVNAELGALRDRLSHNLLPVDQWPLFEVVTARLNDNVSRVYFSLDALIFDGWSCARILDELAALYENINADLGNINLTFRDYVLHEKSLEGSPEYETSKAYWQGRINDLPPGPRLPLKGNPAELRRIRFTRRRGRVDSTIWSKLKTRAAEWGVTSTGILLAAYAEVLTLWSSGSRFCINIPSFNRIPVHEDVNKLIGEFASFTVLDVDNSKKSSFESRAKKHQKQLWSDLDHRHYNGVKVLRDLAKAKNNMGGNLAPVVFTASAHDENGNDVYTTLSAEKIGKMVYAINQTSQVWLDNHVSEQNGTLVIDWDSVDGIFPEGLSQSMFEAYLKFLHQLAADDELWTATQDEIYRFLLPKEQKNNRERVNGRTRTISAQTLPEFFHNSVKRNENQKAIITQDKSLRYSELQDLSYQWAHKLIESGVKQNDTVGIVMEKGWEQIVAVLSILNTGAAYLPIDTNVPSERLQYLLENAQVSTVLTQCKLTSNYKWPEGVKLFSIDTEPVDRYSKNPIPIEQNGEETAFIIYTSGSTGLPKGAMITHRGVVNCVEETVERFKITSRDKVLALTALHHDMSVFDIFGMFAVGGTIVIPDAMDRRDPAHWSELMKREEVSIWNSVPAMMEMMLEYADEHPGSIPQSLRTVFLGGDWISLTLPERLKKHQRNAQVVSVGGPTETTLWNIWYPVREIDREWRSIPYGQPIANTKYYVLNEFLTDCPDWVTGELCCAGIGLAKGYIRDEERTREKFLVHPQTNERLYRTGDLGRYLPDGNIEFQGRQDFQVKINGQRIELGEIESILNKFGKIKNSVVRVIGDRGERKTLAAYYTTEEQKEYNSAELMQFLQERLPAHMVPIHYLWLESMPLTNNGKVDRLALPDPESAQTQAPDLRDNDEDSSIIDRITDIVSRILDIPNPDANTNLITLGANSIDMVRIGNELGKELGTRPRIEQIFRLQTIQAISSFYKKTGKEKKSDAKDETGLSNTTGLDALLRSYKVILEPCKRDEFKKSRPGVRRNDHGKAAIQLIEPPLTEALKRKYRERRSFRTYSLKPIPFAKFSEFISCLRQIELEGNPNKFLYASPGGLNPTQVYIHIKPGRIEGLPGGIYYYHPEEHKLVILSNKDSVDRSIHIPFINQPIFDEAAFSIFLIANLDAIGPGYGERSLHFVTLESGVIAHLLEMNAYPQDIGLCQIGGLEFERIRHLFDLTDRHILIHSLLGGRINHGSDEVENVSCSSGHEPLDKASQLLKKIKQLSKEEIKNLLQANKH